MTDTNTTETVPEAEPEVPEGTCFTLNGETVYAPDGTMLIDACEQNGVHIPRFCYHKRMRAVGMCRMCLVEVDSGRGPALTPSCMVKVGENMVVDTESENTKRAQDAVLELLLINHPLDCPICDKGGECPLQDNAYSFGPGESRFVEEKRHYEKPIPISDTVFLDRERCILCDRCTRFAKEVAGDTFIHFLDRGNNTQVNTMPGDPFSSYFSGNVVQICPVGALTAKPYRFKARPWDLTEVASTYPNAMGDRITVQSSRDEVLRYLGADCDNTNWGWLSDKDRFSFEATNSQERVKTPLMRGNGLGQVGSGDELVATSWHQAMTAAAHAIEDSRNDHGPNGIAVIGGAQLTNESQYAWAKLIKGVIGSDNFDAQLGDGLPADIVAAMPRTTIEQAFAKGSTVLLMSGDPKNELGTLYLRLRHAVLNDGVKLIEMTPTATGLSEIAHLSVRVRPGDIGAVADAITKGEVANKVGSSSKEDLEKLHDAFAAADQLTVIAGRASLAEDPALTVEAINAFANSGKVRFLSALRRGNVHGAIDLGLAPGMLPGRTSLQAAGAWFKEHWKTVPTSVGYDTTSILQECATGAISTLILLGADPLSDYCDSELARAGLAGARTVIAIDPFINASALEYGDIVLPTEMFGEANGSHTNLEGRVTPIAKKVTSAGTCRPDWAIAAELADRIEADLGFESVTDITDEIAAVSPIHKAATADELASNNSGVVVDSEAEDGPDRFIWTDLGKARSPIPGDNYAFRLVIDRAMYDNGTRLSQCPSLVGSIPKASARIHPSEAARLGVKNGDLIRLISNRGAVEGPAQVDARVARGVVAVAHNQSGLDARLLTSIEDTITDVRIETL